VTAEVEGEWMRYSDEAALASRPEAIIMATGGDEKMEVAAALQKSPAVLNRRVYGINGDFLSRPGPRLVDGLEQMARVLHPEAFRQ
jgi:iron complex transport system substrate-binding protein